MNHDRRRFVGRALQAGVASTLLAKTGSAEPADRSGGESGPYRFKLAMWIDELTDADELTLEQELEVARDMGIEHVWFQSVPGVAPIPEMSDAEVDRVGESLARYGRKLLMLSAWIPFHNLPLLDLDLKTMTRNPRLSQGIQGRGSVHADCRPAGCAVGALLQLRLARGARLRWSHLAHALGDPGRHHR